MKNVVLTSVILIAMISITEKSSGQTLPGADKNWKNELNAQLPLLGHRNWILVVDKAFPAQTAPGIEVINTGEELLPVLKYTLGQIGQSTHVKPIIYTDKELNFISPQLEPRVEAYKKSLSDILHGAEVQTILHNSVFEKIDEASKLFRILVLKTEGTIAYSSVFLQLDCKYWPAEKEKVLREAMNKHD